MMNDNEPTKRNDQDLDSIEHGTPKGGKIKVYFDASTHSIEEVRQRIRLAVDGVGLAKDYLSEE